MIIEFHFAGENRKKLAWVVAMIIGTTAEYQYMPTCAYKIGECYTVTKSGNLEISDQADREETERLLAELENQGYAVPDTSELESKGLTVQMPADFFTEHTLGNLRQICENKAALFQTAFQTDSLDIIPSDEKVEFPWFMVEQDGDADAYCTFISTGRPRSALCWTPFRMSMAQPASLRLRITYPTARAFQAKKTGHGMECGLPKRPFPIRN